jgi:hypothetical protein
MSFPAKDRSSCSRHKPISAFVVGRDDDGRRIYRCSGCGAKGVWADGWYAFGPAVYECPHCWAGDAPDDVLCPECSPRRLQALNKCHLAAEGRIAVARKARKGGEG